MGSGPGSATSLLCDLGQIAFSSLSAVWHELPGSGPLFKGAGLPTYTLPCKLGLPDFGLIPSRVTPAHIY